MSVRALRESGHAALRGLVVDGIRRVAPFAQRRNWLRDAGLELDRNGAPSDVPPGDGVAAARPFQNFNFLLHALRTVELASMPRVTGTILSAGCADAYYFTWIESSYGVVDRHIGLELYAERPAGLPDNVQWIESSVGSMDGVDDGTVELIFSGQNIEHLFRADLVDFLLESRRVLAPSGWLVIDSPHRSIASALNWSMAEHTIELTPDEAGELVHLAGFDVVDVRGVWLCREPTTGEILPLWSLDGSGDGEPPPIDAILSRSIRARTAPDDSFVWWLEARRSTRGPDEPALRRRHHEIVTAAEPERRRRLRSNVGTADTGTTVGDRPVISVAAGTSGYAMYGPWMPLEPGHHRVVFRLRGRRPGPDASLVEVATLDVCDLHGNVHASRTVTADELDGRGWVELALDVHADEIIWGTQFRVLVTGSLAVDVLFDVELERVVP